MRILGSCRCNNISVAWKNVDFSLVPRECLCDYCSAKGAAYVSKSGTVVEVSIRKEKMHTVQKHGSQQAKFHECTYCGDVVFVAATVEGDQYCAVNVNCLESRERFPDATSVNFSSQSPAEKFERWKRNWCQLVLVMS